MKIKHYTNERRTKAYLKQLGKWVKVIDGYKYHKESKYDVDDRWLHKVHTFPINKRGDILLVIKPEAFSYDSCGERQPCTYGEIPLVSRGDTCRVLGLFDNTTAGYHGPPEGDYDLELRTRWPGFYLPDIYVDPHFVAYATSSLPPYVFLPHPSKIRDFKRFLPYFSKKPKKLEKILEEYYKIEKSRRNFISLFNNLKKHPK